MNKKVLRTMITLVVVFLVALYVLKIFFPEQFVMAIQNEQFVKIGNFIDQRQWLTLVVSGIMTFVTMYLFVCAVAKRWVVPKIQLILIVAFIASTRLLCLYDASLASGIMTMSMLIIPATLNADLKTTACVFSVHYTSQLLSLKIRDLPFLLTNINSVISISLTFESYLWLLLLYLFNNYKRR